MLFSEKTLNHRNKLSCYFNVRHRKRPTVVEEIILARRGGHESLQQIGEARPALWRAAGSLSSCLENQNALCSKDLLELQIGCR
jgi:hypothetical protein